MTSSTRPAVIQLPRPFRNEDELKQYATKMREVRLKGLANAPGSFSSSLALEIDQPLEFWTTRLTHPEARHFVVCLPDGDETVLNVDALRSTWIATLVLFGPRTIELDNFMEAMSWKHFSDGSPRPAQRPLEGSNLMYYISAMYVDRRFRRQGVGRNLCIETIKAITIEMQTEHAARAICVIGAEHNNTSAIKLYEDLGFERFAVDRFVAKDGRKIVGIQLRLNLEAVIGEH